MKKKLIVGLGNPGKKYKLTRHNLGFELLNNFLLETKVTDNFSLSKKHLSKLTEFVQRQGGIKTKVLLAKPQTFMNHSGQAVKSLKVFYKVSLKNILIVHDDINLPLGEIRLSQNSSAGGHNGVKSIIQHLGSKNFIRLRIGIKLEDNFPTNVPLEKFVLGKFSKTELNLLEKSMDKGVIIINFFLTHNFEETANKYNQKK